MEGILRGFGGMGGVRSSSAHILGKRDVRVAVVTGNYKLSSRAQVVPEPKTWFLLGRWWWGVTPLGCSSAGLSHRGWKLHQIEVCTAIRQAVVKCSCLLALVGMQPGLIFTVERQPSPQGACHHGDCMFS